MLMLTDLTCYRTVVNVQLVRLHTYKIRIS